MDISIALIPRAFLYVFWNLRVTKSCQSTQFSTEQSTQWARATLPEYLEFLAIPNNASIAQDIQHNADWLQNAFTRRGDPPKSPRLHDRAQGPSRKAREAA